MIGTKVSCVFVLTLILIGQLKCWKSGCSVLKSACFLRRSSQHTYVDEGKVPDARMRPEAIFSLVHIRAGSDVHCWPPPGFTLLC